PWEDVPEEDLAAHAISLPKTCLANKCRARANTSQPTKLTALASRDEPGARENTWPNAPTATHAVDARSNALASSFARSLWIRLMSRALPSCATSGQVPNGRRSSGPPDAKSACGWLDSNQSPDMNQNT